MVTPVHAPNDVLDSGIFLVANSWAAANTHSAEPPSANHLSTAGGHANRTNGGDHHTLELGHL